MKICKRCIIPDSFPNVTFENGICSICRNHDRFPRINRNVLGKDKLLEILTSKKTGAYDCVVPLSGGKDSSYVLFYVVRNLGLRPLALFFDSGFATDIAKRNVEKICKNLEVDLVSGEANEFRRKLVKEALYVSRGLGRFAKVCGNCENNLRTFVINEATRREIPFIIWGSTDFEDSSAITSSKSPTFRQGYGAIGNTYGKLVRQLPLLESLLLHGSFVDKCKTVLHGLKYMYCFVRDNIDMKAPEGLKKFTPFLEVSFEGKKVKTIYFYDYIKYDPYKQIGILAREVGWEALPGKEAKMDCKLSSLVSYRHLQDTGITSVGFKLSTLVRNGLLSRAEAMEKEEIVKKDLQKVCKKLGEELGVDVGIIL